MTEQEHNLKENQSFVEKLKYKIIRNAVIPKVRFQISSLR